MSPDTTEDGAIHGFGVPTQSTMIVNTIGGIEYCLDQAPTQVITIQRSSSSDRPLSGLKGDLYPCTVIDTSKEQLNKEDLDAISAKFALQDDVWTHAFLESEY